MLDILHPFEELVSARPEIVTKYHRKASCDANHGVDEHNGPFATVLYDHRISAC